MKIIKTYQEALDFCEPYLSKEFVYPEANQLIESSFMPSAKQGPWEMSSDALKLTLQYLFEHLHHACYVLCSDGSKSVLVKIENSTTAPFFKTILQKELEHLNENTTITDSHKRNIGKFVTEKDGTISNRLRILQCIVKKAGEKNTTSSEYETFFKGIVLPTGVYIMNLTDANLLHKDGLEPFPVYRGNNPMLPAEYRNSRFLPIFSLGGNTFYYDIPIPNYDDVIYVLGQAKYTIDDFETNWSEKIEKAVFRGGPSGCGTTIETNQRLRLATIKSPDLDVGIVGDKGSIDSNSVRFDPVVGLSMLNTGIPAVERLSYKEQSHYKYLIHVDGNVNAYRLLSTMATGSLILRVKSSFTSWIDPLIVAGEHYIEVLPDLSNLLERIEWCKTHDQECSDIAQNALRFSRMALTPDYVRGAFQKIVLSVVEKPLVQKPVFIKKIVPKKISAVPESDFYIKGENEKKCPTGYIQDKNDKTKKRCVKKDGEKTMKQPVSPVPEKIKSPIQPVPKTSIEEESDFYIKGDNEKKCPTGYIQDKNDKTKKRCVKKDGKKTMKQPVSPVPEKIKSPIQPVPKTSIEEESDFYIKGDNEKKCPTGYIQDKNDKTKKRCIKKDGKKTIKQPPIKTPTFSPISVSDPRKKCDLIRIKIQTLLNHKK
jgi:hypothetical protein